MRQVSADEILLEFILSYLNRDKNLTAEDWLNKKLLESLPDVSPKTISEIQENILQSLNQIDIFMNDAKNSAEKSYNPETWFYQKLMDNINDENFRNFIFHSDDILKILNQDIFDISRNVENMKDFDRQAENLNAKVKAEKISEPQVNNFLTSEAIRAGLTKSMLAQYQKTLRTDLGSMNIRTNDLNEVAYSLSKNAALNGVGGLILTTGLSMALKNNLREMKQREILKMLVNAGTTNGLRSAVAGALKVGAERGVFPVLSRATPAVALTAIASIGIENSKIFYNYAKGKINGWQAIDQAGRISTSTIYALGFSVKGAAIGATSLAVIPFAGPLVGGFLGRVVGNLVGSKVGNFSYNSVKNLVLFAKDFVTVENELLEVSAYGMTKIKNKIRETKKIFLVR